MEVYSYDPGHGAYTGATVADASPLEPGVFLYPAYTTVTKPPNSKDGFVPVWNGKKWTNTPDYRGETWFDGEGNSVIVEQPGDPAKMGLSKDPPGPSDQEQSIPTVTPLQLRNWLRSKGLRDKVEPLIASLPDDERGAAEDAWEYAGVYEHDNPFVMMLGAALELSPEDIEQGFREAAKL